jgi:hypothetical protein
MHRLLQLLFFIIALVQSFPRTTAARDISERVTARSKYAPLQNWMYLGCFNETTLNEATDGERALYDGISESLATMTVRMCVTFCDSNRFVYAGMEYFRYAVFPIRPSLVIAS